MAAKEIYRPTMSSDVIFELVDILEQTKRTVGLSTNMRKFLSKLDTLAYEIGKGTRAPAYVATGIKAKTEITLESLGADINANVIVDRRGNPTAIDLSKYTEKQIEDAKERELYEFTISGIHTDWQQYLPTPIVIEERRKENLNSNNDLDDSHLGAMFGEKQA